MNIIDRIKLKSLISFILSVIEKLITLYHKATLKDKIDPVSPKKPWRLLKRRKHNENN